MPFTGFGPEAVAFFMALQRDNSKAFFDAHRDEYVEAIRQPIEALLGEAEPVYGAGRVLRPNRDVRFSKDKTPYRLNAGMWAGRVGAVYLQLSAAGIQAGGGLYEPSRDQLVRARQAIDERPTAADALQKTLDRLARAGFSIEGPGLATAPRGYARDHPRIELLRLQHYAVLADLPTDVSPAEIRRTWKAVEPLIEWAETWVGAAQSWP